MTEEKKAPVKKVEPFTGVHRFEDSQVRQGVNVLLCVKCPRVWWPDKPRPGGVCTESRLKNRKGGGGAKPSIENPRADLMAPGGTTRPRKNP